MIINQAIDKSEIGEDTSEFILNHVKMQDKYIGRRSTTPFKNLCGEIPLFEKEARGTEMIGRVTAALFTGA